MEIINTIAGFILVAGMGYVAYISCVLVSEKKARFKAGTHDYYDRPINEKENTK